MVQTSNSQEHQHFIIFKPFGYLSQFVNNQIRRKNKKMLGELYSFPENTMAIGRLDETSEGLLFLTTDGKMSEFIRSSKIEKEYYAQVDGEITSEAIEKLNKTPQLPERAKKIRDERHGPTSWISITLREGKFRQVRKMTAVVGFPTLRLVRVRIGKIHINKMTAGEVIKTDDFHE